MPEGKHFYEFGPFRLDPAERLLLRNDQTVSLAPKVFDTLLLLVENSGHLLSKDELMKRLWPETFVEEVNLAQNISAIRRVLDDKSGGAHYIETVAKGGYRFTAATRKIVPEPPKMATVEAKPPAVAVPDPRVRRWPVKRLAAAACATILVMVSFLFLIQRIGKFGARRTPATPVTPAIRSIAVLPLVNLSSDPEQEYFSDGMTDELITDLAKFGGLRVISHTSVERYKQTKRPLPEIARELGVDAVVEGTVMRSGERVRITAQLIDARSDRHLWAESYERDLRDVLGLQAEVSREIAAKIQINMPDQERTRLASPNPVSPEAHEAYLKGRYFWNKRTEEGVRKGIEYFEQATRLDPKYATAYAGLAESYVVLNGHRYLPAAQAFPKVRAAALQALELDERIAEAHTSLGSLKWEYEWDKGGAEKEYRRAIELNPSYATAHQWYAEELAALGRRDEAMAEIKRAQELDPLSLPISTVAGWILYLGRHNDEAIDQYQRTLEMDSNFAIAHAYLGRAQVRKGNFEQAIIECQTATKLSDSHPFYLAWLGYAYAMSGHRNEALRIIYDLQTISRRKYVASHDIAAIYAGLGERSKALVWLNKAYDERSYTVLQLEVEPEFDLLRSEPRFQELMHRIGFPQ
jgi:TolB-like protein/DNA-binding winged helix-turn-helix (wHTH) protein/tetratricopeptide (TPR) repeat protein